jgi:NhaA family Na+:H+ antiporter
MTTAPSKKPQVINLLREFSIPLIAGVIAALVWANIDYVSYHHAIHDNLWGFHSLHFLTNDIFMVLFFGIAAVEITSNLAPGGSLNPVSRAINPLLATLGGVLMPVIFFFLLNAVFGSAQLSRGWGIPTATDIALAWLVARMTFGDRHPCVSFLLLLAVADDAISLAIIAVFYPSPGETPQPVWLLLVLLGIALALLLRRFRVTSYWPYLIFGGLCAWWGLHLGHLHPALALVFIVPFMPHRKDRPDETVFDEADHSPSTLQRFEHDWKIIVDFGLFLFGLCNAGVAFTAVGPITAIVLLALLLGKTIGVAGFAYLAALLGFPLPSGVGVKELFVTGLIAAIGLTVALFVAGEAYTDAGLQDAAKMGALASAAIGPIAMAAGRLLRIKRIASTE